MCIDNVHDAYLHYNAKGGHILYDSLMINCEIIAYLVMIYYQIISESIMFKIKKPE